MSSFEEREKRRSRGIVSGIINDEVIKPGIEKTAVVPNTDTEYDSMVKSKKPAEGRNFRTNILLPKSLYDEARKKCNKMNMSFNECINQLLNAWLGK